VTGARASGPGSFSGFETLREASWRVAPLPDRTTPSSKPSAKAAKGSLLAAPRRPADPGRGPKNRGRFNWHGTRVSDAGAWAHLKDPSGLDPAQAGRPPRRRPRADPPHRRWKQLRRPDLGRWYKGFLLERTPDWKTLARDDRA